jgi:hypothetical protein
MRLGGLLAPALTTCSLASAQPAPPWHPWFKAAIRYASLRDGTIAFPRGHDYGKETLRGIAARLLRGLPSRDSDPR